MPFNSQYSDPPPVQRLVLIANIQRISLISRGHGRLRRFYYHYALGYRELVISSLGNINCGVNYGVRGRNVLVLQSSGGNKESALLGWHGTIASLSCTAMFRVPPRTLEALMRSHGIFP